MIQTEMTFDGPRDTLHPGLPSQYTRVFQLMSDGEWRTLWEISRETGASEAAASARLRDARKARFGAHTVLRRLRKAGLWEYRLEK